MLMSELAKRQQAPAEKSRHRGELFTGAGRGVVGAAIRRRVQRGAEHIHSEHLRRFLDDRVALRDECELFGPSQLRALGKLRGREEDCQLESFFVVH